MEYILVSGVAAAQGRRETMEDAHVTFDDALAFAPGVEGYKKVSFYAVYDGHGGTTSAELLKKNLHGNVLASESFKTHRVSEALVTGFKTTDKAIVDQANAEGWMNGSTAVVGIVVDGHLHMANIGDSEAILVAVNGEGKNQITVLTTPHKASDPTEKERIEKLGGHVFFGRVFGALAVSRAFGDSRYKMPKTSQDFVTCDPALHQVELDPSHKFLVLACDGLWDVMNHQTVADLVHRFYTEGKNPSDVAQMLVSEALRRRTEDNVSVIVVYINWNDENSDDDDSDDEEAVADAKAAPAAPQDAAQVAPVQAAAPPQEATPPKDAAAAHVEAAPLHAAPAQDAAPVKDAAAPEPAHAAPTSSESPSAATSTDASK
jgi:serine/threonine protein phosphatase PrpC